MLFSLWFVFYREFGILQLSMQRSEFEALAAPLFRRFRNLLRRCFSETGKSTLSFICTFSFAETEKTSIDVVELVGGAMRTPMLRQIVVEETGLEPMTTMNMDEAVARGAAIQCAILSPAFKVGTCIYIGFS